MSGNVSNSLDGKAESHYGFVPPRKVVFLRWLCKAIISALRLDGKTAFSNEFMQMLDPKLAVRWEGARKDIVFRTGHGRLLWRAKTFNTEEPMMLEWIESFSETDVFLDIGANVGTYTIPAALKADAVYACELDPINIGLLKENIHLNKVYGKVVILPFACAENTGVENIYYRDFSRGDALQSVGGASPFNTQYGSDKHMCPQLVMSIDTAFETFALKQPTKIKIDVDGNERTVFMGAKKIIAAADEIYFEDSGLPDSKFVIDRIVELGFVEAKRTPPVNPAAQDGNNILFRKSNRPIGR